MSDSIGLQLVDAWARDPLNRNLLLLIADRAEELGIHFDGGFDMRTARVDIRYVDYSHGLNRVSGLLRRLQDAAVDANTHRSGRKKKQHERFVRHLMHRCGDAITQHVRPYFERCG